MPFVGVPMSLTKKEIRQQSFGRSHFSRSKLSKQTLSPTDTFSEPNFSELTFLSTHTFVLVFLSAKQELYRKVTCKEKVNS